MSDEVFNYGMGDAQYASMQNLKLVQPTCKQRIELAVAQAEERLKQVRRAQELLDKNPDLQELIDIMARNHF